MSIQGNGASNQRANNYTGDRIPFSDRTNKNGKPSRKKFDPSRQTCEEEQQSQVNEEDIESLKNATHQSIIEQNLRRSREAGEKSDIRKSDIHRQSSQRFDPYKREVEEKISNHSLDEVDRQAMLQIQDYRRKARERWEDEIRRQTAPLVNETDNNEIHSKHSSSEGDPLSDSSNSPSYNTEAPLDPVRQAAVERMQKLQNNPEAVVYLYQGGIYVFENFKSAKEKAKFGENTINKLDELEHLGRGHTVEGVRYIDVEDGINGIKRYGLELVNVPEVEKPQDRQADAIEAESLFEIKPAKKRVTFAPNLEEVRFFNKVPEWMRDLKRGDFEEFYQRPLKVEDFTKNSQDILREDEAIHEGEYSAREKIAHDKLIDHVDRKLRERLGLVRTDSTGIAKIRFYTYESHRGDLLFTNKKYTDQDCTNRDLKRVSLDYAVEKLEYLEAQGAVKWKLPPAYAIKSESNTIATYDKNLAEHMMANDGYEELMPGTRDGIDLSDPDGWYLTPRFGRPEQEGSEIYAKVRKSFQ